MRILIRIDKEEYNRLLKVDPFKVKRTKSGYYLLGKNKWISNPKEKKKLLKSKYKGD